ncbi:hypothetical protein [Chondromyces apiculatus]|uniref:Outer membrane protein beta-barrel domain-containing protein n=1 Tax=Chondromyces apiculatus DSM 436 TaxID=1192034 RepID=A0A017SWK5_9BACT|nr:hypothetical protein [Chondromyces apiculatus]EYF00980.1 Hypothetical protein CAP_8848 [Chondromyces apiculatus DSM 436]
MRTLVLAAAFALVATPALAQEAPAPADVERPSDTHNWTRSQNNRVGLEVDLFSSSQKGRVFGETFEFSSLGLPITPVLQLELIENLYLDVEIPLGYGSVSNNGDSTGGFVFGNPTLGAHYAAALSDSLTFHVGGTVSIPTIHDPDEEQGIAASFSAITRAQYDIYRFIPESIGVRARGGVEVRILPYLYYRGDIAPTVFIPTGDDEAEILIDQGNEIEARSEGGFGGGLRFQASFLLTDDDLVQTALEPFVSYEPKPSGLYARLGMLIALDETLGFGFDEGKVLSGRLGIGYKW